MAKYQKDGTEIEYLKVPLRIFEKIHEGRANVGEADLMLNIALSSTATSTTRQQSTPTTRH